MARRAILLVLDGCGAGAAPDAAAFGDFGSPSTLLHVWDAVSGFEAPNLARVGFLAAAGIGAASDARYGRLRELSQGKDSVTGHWEMMGVVTEAAFPTYPNGFPASELREFEARAGVGILGNCAASGTEIISRLGVEHMSSGRPIVYTSADSVFQIAAHEDVVPIERLYQWCTIAREIFGALRVIARPFEGVPGDFRRTERRKDFPIAPPPNLLDVIGDAYGIGVVPELFDGRGFRAVSRTQSNPAHAVALDAALDSDARLIFANFEDFDMLYGHRNDASGFARCLEEFDAMLGRWISRLRPDDLLILTADHGNDPTDASTDHSREYVPVALNGAYVAPADLGDVDGMTAVGATVSRHLGVDWAIGTSLI